MIVVAAEESSALSPPSPNLRAVISGCASAGVGGASAKSRDGRPSLRLQAVGRHGDFGQYCEWH